MSSSSSSSSSQTRRSHPDRSQQSLRLEQSKSQHRRRSSRPRVTCSYCHENGHTAEDCPLLSLKLQRFTHNLDGKKTLPETKIIIEEEDDPYRVPDSYPVLPKRRAPSPQILSQSSSMSSASYSSIGRDSNPIPDSHPKQKRVERNSNKRNNNNNNNSAVINAVVRLFLSLCLSLSLNIYMYIYIWLILL